MQHFIFVFVLFLSISCHHMEVNCNLSKDKISKILTLKLRIDSSVFRLDTFVLLKVNQSSCALIIGNKFSV